MWFADIGLALSGILLGAWLLVALIVGLGGPRGGAAHRLRGTGIVVGGVAATLFAAQAAVVDAVDDGSAAARLDGPVLDWFLAHRSGVATPVMVVVSAVGGTAGMAVLTVLGAGLLWWIRRRAMAGVVVVAALGAAVLSPGFKQLYARARPPSVDQITVESTFALPSGHALGSIVVIGVLTAAAVLVVGRCRRTALVCAGAAGIVLIGVSRLYLGVHWLTDVLTGWLLGGAWLAVCIGASVLIGRHDGVSAAQPTEQAQGTAGVELR